MLTILQHGAFLKSEPLTSKLVLILIDSMNISNSTEHTLLTIVVVKNGTRWKKWKKNTAGSIKVVFSNKSLSDKIYLNVRVLRNRETRKHFTFEQIWSLLILLEE